MRILRAEDINYTPGSTNIAGWTRIEDAFAIENGDIPAGYVSLPGVSFINWVVVSKVFHFHPEPWGRCPIEFDIFHAVGVG